jgi:hypothetical protein
MRAKMRLVSTVALTRESVVLTATKRFLLPCRRSGCFHRGIGHGTRCSPPPNWAVGIAPINPSEGTNEPGIDVRSVSDMEGRLSYLGAGNIVLNQLVDEVNVVPPFGQTVGCLLHAGACSFDDKDSIASQNVVQLQTLG